MITLFLTFLLSCDATPESNRYLRGPLIYGVDYDSDYAFVANYAEHSKAVGVFLDIPIVFKLTKDEQFLYIFRNGDHAVATRNSCNALEYEYAGFTYIILTKEKCVKVKTRTGTELKLKKKSMI